MYSLPPPQLEKPNSIGSSSNDYYLDPHPRTYISGTVFEGGGGRGYPGAISRQFEIEGRACVRGKGGKERCGGLAGFSLDRISSLCTCVHMCGGGGRIGRKISVGGVGHVAPRRAVPAPLSRTPSELSFTSTPMRPNQTTDGFRLQDLASPRDQPLSVFAPTRIDLVSSIASRANFA